MSIPIPNVPRTEDQREINKWRNDVKTAIKRRLFDLPVYANNAAAVAGGLVVGDFYQTGADPSVVCVVTV